MALLRAEDPLSDPNRASNALDALNLMRYWDVQRAGIQMLSDDRLIKKEQELDSSAALPPGWQHRPISYVGCTVCAKAGPARPPYWVLPFLE